MRLLTLLMTSAFLAVIAPGASAQTTTTKSAARRDFTLTSPQKTKSTYQRKTTRSAVPPAPAVPVRSSRRVASRVANPTLIGIDETGRRDLAGRPVPHYPSVRGIPKAGSQGGPVGSHKSGYVPKTNPQKVQ